MLRGAYLGLRTTWQGGIPEAAVPEWTSWRERGAGPGRMGKAVVIRKG